MVRFGEEDGVWGCGVLWVSRWGDGEGVMGGCGVDVAMVVL